MENYSAGIPEAFDLEETGNLIAIVGGGGKSSLMFKLAKHIGGRVVLTTTTRIFAAQMKLALAVCQLPSTEDNRREVQTWNDRWGIELLSIDNLGKVLERNKHCLVVGDIQGEKALGVDEQLPAKLLARPDVDSVIVEADGSRMRPVKAPASHEPAIPDGATQVIPVAGIDAVGGKLRQVAHRPELVSRLTGVALDQSLTIDALAKLISHPNGGLKSVPEGARVTPLINKVESEQQLETARRVASGILAEQRIQRVIIGAMKQAEPIIEVQTRVTAIILAAGESQRMGQTKQLLPWGPTTVLGQVIQNLKKSRVHQIVVVTGYMAQEVSAIATAEGISTIHNADYARGEMLSSLQAALKRRPESSAAILVVLADQPQVGFDVVDQILIAYWQGRGKIVAPSFRERRGNPVLFDAYFVDKLLNLPRGSAPREILRRYPQEVCLVPVDTAAIIQDLDLPHHYERWRPG